MNGEVAILNQYPKDRYNVLMASTATQMTAWHKVVVCQVVIDPNKDSGDVYPQTGGMAFSKQALMRLADAAGIRFVGTDSDRADDGSITCTVHGVMMKADGMEHQLIGTYTWDVPVRLEQAKLDAQKRSKQATAQDLLNVRKFAHMRAETGAMERLIRSALGLKSAYSQQDLRKPFVVARIVTDFAQDPVIRLALGLKMAGQALTEGEVVAIAAALREPGPAQAPQLADGAVQELSAGEKQEQEPEPTETNGNGEYANDWVGINTRRGAFWAKTADMALDHNDVHEACGVETMKEFAGTFDEAIAACNAWLGAKLEAEAVDRAEQEGPPY